MSQGIEVFNTAHLKPIRCIFSNYVITIIYDGSVCFETLQKRKGFMVISCVYRLSQDGLRIVVYKPCKCCLLVDNKPPHLPIAEDIEIYGYENLPPKHVKVYELVSKFITIVKANTAKLTYYTQFGKSVIKENGDFEVTFSEGEKILRPSKAPGTLKFISPEQKQPEIPENLLGYFLLYEKTCQELENTLQRIGNKTHSDYFPAVFSRDSKNFSPATLIVGTGSRNSHSSVPEASDSAVACPHMTSRKRSSALQGQPEDATEDSTSNTELGNSQSDKIGHLEKVEGFILKKAFAKGIGWVSQLVSEGIKVKFIDGIQVRLEADDTHIYVTDKTGKEKMYCADIRFPEFLREKVLLLHVAATELNEK